MADESAASLRREIEHSASPVARLLGHSLAAALGFVGIALISLHTLPLELKTAEVSVLDVIGTPIERTWYVVHMNSKRLLPAGQRFRQFLLEQAAPGLDHEFGRYLIARAAS